LDCLDLEIRPGEILAIAGRNGSGKTTLIKLLCRMYDPTGGSIKIDNCDLRDFQVSALRHEMSVLFQDYAKYQFSVNENIWLGSVDAPLQRDLVRQSASAVNADQFIEQLQDGYDTRLGNWFDNSVELSQGEWQKIALARTLYRKAQILILDEPTSSLDTESETIAIRNLRQHAKDRITIIVSHRLTSLHLADRVIVMDAGKIRESGTHLELLQLQGLYCEMYESQIEGKL